MMNNIRVPLLIVLVIVLNSCNEEQIVITGKYPAPDENTMLYAQLARGNQSSIIDSVEVSKNGKFRFKFELNAPELVTILNADDEPINLITGPGDRINLDINEGSFRKDYNIEGSEPSKDIKMLVGEVEETKIKLDSILRKINALEDPDSPEGGKLSDAYLETFNRQKKYNIRYILDNMSSLASVYALYQRVTSDLYIFNNIYDLQYFKIVADSVKVRYPESSLAQTLVNDVNNRVGEYNRTIAIKKLTDSADIETGLVNLEIENVEGRSVSLKSFKGKVVLLTFWASWNEQSIEANRTLKSIYNSYHKNGFEVYAVALENDKNSWRRTINYEDYPWINVSELNYPSSYAASIYNVKELPSNYLIDREGNIVAKNIYGKRLATWLDNLI
ncbi:MAG TPA: TlpA disulfide reductase family protein [Bacteroidales bacterium]|nr:TlpA disulfide reductase family protein [Bacteroidales bacterium]